MTRISKDMQDLAGTQSMILAAIMGEQITLEQLRWFALLDPQVRERIYRENPLPATLRLVGSDAAAGGPVPEGSPNGGKPTGPSLCIGQ